MASATMGPRRRVQQSSTSSASSSSGSSSASSSSSGGSKRTRSDNNNSPSQGNLNGEPAPKKTRSSSQRLAKAKEAQEMAKKVVPPLWNDPRPYASIAGLSIEAQQALCAEGALPSPMSYMSATMSATMASFVGSAAAQLGGGSGSGSNRSGPSSSSSSNAAAAAAAAAMSYLDISNMTARPPGWLPGGPGGNDESTASVGGALGGLSQAFIPPFASVSATATTAAAVPATLPSKTCTSTSTSTSTITSNSSTKTSSPSPVNTPTISSSSTSVSTNNLVSNASSTSTVSLATSSSINTSVSVSVSASTNTSTKSAGSPPPPPVLGVLPPTSEVTPAGSPSPGDQMVVVRSDFPNDPMFGAYQPWVIKTYGDLAKTKTITIKKYARILRTLRGEEVNSAENSKFRFWVKSKGFHIGQPEGYDAKPADRIVGRHAVTNPGLDPPLYVPYQLPHNKALNGAEGTVPPGRVYKKVAIVENFFDIIHAVHVDLEGRPGKHAGQKRTYRTITETYAFLPREAVTRFLLGCTECQRRPRTPSPTSLSVASPTPACSTPTPTSASTTSAVGSPSPATTSAASTLIGSEASASATATLTTAISTPTVASTIATTLAATTGAVTATTTNSQEQTKEKPASPKPATTLSSSELEPLLAQVGTATKEASHPSDQSHKGLPSPSPRSPTSPTVVVVEQQQPKSTATVSTGTSTPVVFSGPTFPNNDLKLFNDAIACVTSGNSNVTAFVGINSSINNVINGTGTTPTMSTTTMSSGLPASKPKDDRYNPLSITNLLRKDPVPARRPNPVPLINGVLPSAQVPLVSLESSDAAAPLMTPAAPPNFEPSCTAPARGLRVVPEDQLLRAARSTPSPSLGASSVIWNPEIPSKSSPLGIPVGATTPVDYSRSLCAAFSRQPQLHPLTQSLQSLQPASIIEAIKRESEALQAAAGRRTLPSSIAKSLPLPLTTAADAALRMTATTKTTNGVSHSSESEGEDPENEAFSPAAGLIDTNLNLLATIQQLHCQVMLALTERLRPAVTTSPSGIVGSSHVHHRHSNGPPAADES